MARNVVGAVMYFFGAALLFIPQILRAKALKDLSETPDEELKAFFMEIGCGLPLPSAHPLSIRVKEHATQQGIEIDSVYLHCPPASMINALVLNTGANKAIVGISFNPFNYPGGEKILKAILGHEFSHVRNNDTSRNILASLVPRHYISLGVGVMTAAMFMPFLWPAGLAVLGTGVGLAFLKRANNRREEYIADIEGALMMDEPQYAADILDFMARQEAAFTKKPGWLSGLFDTHPPLEDRVTHLRDAFNLASKGEKPDSRKEKNNDDSGPDLRI